MKKFYFIFLGALLSFSFGCHEERILTPNTHDGRVPDVLNFTAKLDSSITANKKKYVVQLHWVYDTIRYATNPNLKNWEVYRVIANDTMTYKFQLQTYVEKPRYADSSVSIQPGGRDSVVVLYRVIPIGIVDANNIQFTGRPSEIARISIKK